MFEEGASLATKMDLLFFETSAKTGHNIDDVKYILNTHIYIYISNSVDFL